MSTHPLLVAAHSCPRLCSNQTLVLIVKNCIMPLAMVEHLYRQHPEVLEKVWVTNSHMLQDAAAGLVVDEMSSYLDAMDIFHDHKMEFVDRFKLPYFLSNRTDIVLRPCHILGTLCTPVPSSRVSPFVQILSWQWQNELNFLYLDALHAHYPLVHNSPYFKDCGYYYEQNDVGCRCHSRFLSNRNGANQGADRMPSYGRATWQEPNLC